MPVSQLSPFAMRGDGGAAGETGVFVYGQARRFNVAMQISAALQRAPLGRDDVSFDRPLNRNGCCPDVTDHCSVRADSQLAGRGNVSFHLSIDHEFGAEFHVAFDRNAAG